MTLVHAGNQATPQVEDAAGGSTSVTVAGGANGATVVGAVFDGTGDTVAMTLDGEAPTLSNQSLISGSRGFAFAWAAPATGSQTLAWSGGDADDGWSLAFADWSDMDQSTPYDGYVFLAPGASTPDAIGVATQAGSIVHAMIVASGNPTVSGTGTQLGESSISGVFINHQRAPGTGVTVNASWSASADTFQLVGINVRAAAGDITVNVTGVSATGAAGTVAIAASADVPVTGVAGTGAAGTPAVDIGITIEPTGVSGAGAVGSPVVTASADVPITGVEATGAVGDPDIFSGIVIVPEGVVGTTFLGLLTLLGVTEDPGVHPSPPVTSAHVARLLSTRLRHKRAYEHSSRGPYVTGDAFDRMKQ
jgi:hypothetical protein